MKTFVTALSSWAVALGCFAAQNDYHTFTSTEGKTLEAKILRVMEKQFIIQAKNGKTYTVDKSLFGSEDQDYIKKWEKEEAKNYIPTLEVQFASGKGDAKDGSDYDNRTQVLTPKVTVLNRDTRFTVKNATAHVVMFGKDVLNSRRIKVLTNQQFQFSAEPGQAAEWEGKSVKAPYDDNSAAQFGHKFNGYVVVVVNESGKTIHTAGSSNYKNYGDAAKELKSGTTMLRSDLGK